MPPEVAVSLNGPQVALDKLDLGAVVPEVTVTEEMLAKPGSHRADVALRGLPTDIKVGSVVPPTVTLKIAPAPKTKKFAAGGR